MKIVVLGTCMLVNMLSIKEKIAIFPLMGSMFMVLIYNFFEAGFGREYFNIIREIILGYCTDFRKVLLSYAFSSWDLEGILTALVE